MDRPPSGAATSTPTAWPASRPGCGRPTTGASRPACSGRSSRPARAGPRLVAAGARRQPAPDQGRGRVRPRDRRLRAVRAGRRARLPVARPARARRRRGRRPRRAALVGRPAGDRAGGRDGRRRGDHRTSTPRSTTCRVNASRRPGGCAAWRPRSATVARPTIRTGRAEPGGPTGRRSRGCCASRIEA